MENKDFHSSPTIIPKYYESIHVNSKLVYLWIVQYQTDTCISLVCKLAFIFTTWKITCIPGSCLKHILYNRCGKGFSSSILFEHDESGNSLSLDFSISRLTQEDREKPLILEGCLSASHPPMASPCPLHIWESSPVTNLIHRTQMHAFLDDWPQVNSTEPQEHTWRLLSAELAFLEYHY